jgi:hypothetical protein
MRFERPSDGALVRCRLRPSLTHSEVRSLPCSVSPSTALAGEARRQFG